ncbi:MAG: hypothetical protein ABUS57_08220 [Pseudomonadota bacterium]
MRITLLIAGLCAAFLATPCHAQATPPDCSAAQHRAFDFWLGEWDAYVTGTDNLAGHSTIASEDSGCVITEHWRSVGQPYTGRSLNLYDRATGHWRQNWADSTGDVTDFVGDPTADGMQLTAPNDVSPGLPTPHFTRMTFTRNADGSVRQLGESSADGHAWTTRYDFTYRRHIG